MERARSILEDRDRYEEQGSEALILGDGTNSNYKRIKTKHITNKCIKSIINANIQLSEQLPIQTSNTSHSISTFYNRLDQLESFLLYLFYFILLYITY
tara:strand:- start:99 stop:392 length:294 start_codon:yes stop_codon:yes gene_type:complete